MKNITTFLLTLISLTSFSQSITAITQKVSDKICDCMKDNFSSYPEIKPEFNRCYDLEFNQIFSLADSAEQKILVQKGALQKIKNKLIPTLHTNYEKIRSIVQLELENSIEPAAYNNKAPCPTNFMGKDLKNIKKLEGEIIAFHGLVTEAHTTPHEKAYYQVKLEGGKTIWVASLVNSEYEKEGKIIRLLGYVSEVGNNEIAKQYNQTDHHILAFCVIDMESKQMAMMPGSELQVKEWMNGTIPKEEK